MSSSKSDLIKFTFQAAGEQARVVSFTATEEVSSPYEIKLKLASEKSLSWSDLLGTKASLTIKGASSKRRFRGLLTSFSSEGSKGRFHIYRASLAPRLKLLELRKNSRVFHNKTAEEIVSELLKEGGITSDSFKFALSEDHPARVYRVQLQETDLEFINRILAEEGIFYFFEHGGEKTTLIFGDSKAAWREMEGANELKIHPGAVPDGEERVRSFGFQKRLTSDRTTLGDFNPERPSLDLTVSKQAEEIVGAEIYEYPGGQLNKEAGDKLAAMELSRATADHKTGRGESDCPRLSPGFKFALDGHETEELNTKYLPTKAKHVGKRPLGPEGESSETKTRYQNFFFCLSENVDFRPRKRKKPLARGVQTAIVAGPKGEDIYTDEQGRIKVRFHWDRQAEGDEKSSCWIRVAQSWAGAGWGTVFIPRIGQEVIVDFINGDPDKPVVTGCVYNAADAPPWPLPERKSAVGIKNPAPDGGQSSEIMLDDKQGEEELRLTAQKDRTDSTENNHSLKVGGERTIEVKGKETHNNEADFSRDLKGSYKLAAAGEEITLALESAGRISLRNNALSLKETLDDILNHMGAALRFLEAGMTELAAHTHTSAAPGSPTSPPVSAANAARIAAEATSETAKTTTTVSKVSALLK